MSDINVDPMKKSSIYATFGRYYGEKLYKLLYDCCSGRPGSFCYEVLKCLGISPQGDNSKFLNQQGQWEYVSTEIVDITTAQLLTLMSANTVQNATYNITDVEGFESVIVQGFAPNMVSPEAVGFLYVPEYTPTGNYKGQYHSSLGAISDGDIYTWGQWNYLNDSGGALTPDLPSEDVFDTLNRFTQLPKSTSNNYKVIGVTVNLDGTLAPNSVVYINGNFLDVNLAKQATGFDVSLLLAWYGITPTVIGNKGVIFLNCRIHGSSGILGNSCDGGFAIIQNVRLDFSDSLISENTFEAQSNIQNVNDFGTGRILLYANHIGSGTCEVKNATCDDGTLEIQSVLLDHGSTLDTIDVTNGAIFKLQDSNITRFSELKNVSISEDYSLCFPELINYSIDGLIVNTLFTYSNAVVRLITSNGTGTTYLTSFTNRDLNNVNIVGGKGWFTIEHNFITNPITAGNSVLYGLIPNGAVCTNATLIVDTALGGLGLLQIGIDTDAPNYVIPATAAGSVVNTLVNTLSATTTGNRSLRLAASVGDITSGVVKIKIEFVV